VEALQALPLATMTPTARQVVQRMQAEFELD
jgi:hypothetical protein